MWNFFNKLKKYKIELVSTRMSFFVNNNNNNYIYNYIIIYNNNNF